MSNGIALLSVRANTIQQLPSPVLLVPLLTIDPTVTNRLGNSTTRRDTVTD